MRVHSFVKARRVVKEEFFVEAGSDIMGMPCGVRTLPCSSSEEANEVAKLLASRNPDAQLTLIGNAGDPVYVGAAVVDKEELDREALSAERRKALDASIPKWPKVVLTIPKLGTETQAGEASLTVSLVIDGVAYEGKCVLQGKTSTEYSRTVSLERVHGSQMDSDLIADVGALGGGGGSKA